MSDISAIDNFLGDMRREGRFAPKPKQWADFHRVLTRGIDQDAWPPLPLILSAHWSTTAQEKHSRLEVHLHWAEDHGRLDDAISYLLALSEDDWCPMTADQWAIRCGDL